MKQSELRILIRESIENLMEDINVPINVGDTVLGGKFKNKKIKVKDIDKNEKGDITINDKPLLRVRIPKEVNEGSVKKSDRVDIYRDNNFIVVRPLTETASCKYGAFSKWCISAPGSGAWESSPDAIVIMILQKNYKISPKKQALIDKFLEFKDAEDTGDLTPELEMEMEQLLDSHNYHDFEDLSKIALIFTNSSDSAEIWDFNNIPISDNYMNGWQSLPISNDVIDAIENYVASVKSNKHQLAESYTENNIFFHGTKTKLPFERFDSSMDGSGIVSSGRKYGGFFFTSSLENAEFYTEYFICKTKIDNIEPSPLPNKNPPETLRQAVVDNKIYIVEDVLDGAVFSDVVIVPYSELNNVEIIGWEFVGDKEFYFSQLDELFGMDEEDSFITKDMINEFCQMTETNLNFLLSIDVFKEYYLSKN